MLKELNAARLNSLICPALLILKTRTETIMMTIIMNNNNNNNNNSKIYKAPHNTVALGVTTRAPNDVQTYFRCM